MTLKQYWVDIYAKMNYDVQYMGFLFVLLLNCYYNYLKSIWDLSTIYYAGSNHISILFVYKIQFQFKSSRENSKHRSCESPLNFRYGINCIVCKTLPKWRKGKNVKNSLYLCIQIFYKYLTNRSWKLHLEKLQSRVRGFNSILKQSACSIVTAISTKVHKTYCKKLCTHFCIP